MQRPKSDKYVEFENGGVALDKINSQKIQITFYTKLNRIVTGTTLQFYLFKDNKSKEAYYVIESSWTNTMKFVPEKALSLPSEEKIEEVIAAAKELLGLPTS